MRTYTLLFAHLHICTQESLENCRPICPIRPQQSSGEVWKCISQNHVPLYHDSPQMPMYMRVEAWYMMLLHVPYMYHSWHQRNKKTAENLQISEKVLIFAARMRVAYRRDYIKLRNRSFIQSRWSSTCGFSF